MRSNSSMPSDAVFLWRADAPQFFGQARELVPSPFAACTGG